MPAIAVPLIPPVLAILGKAILFVGSAAVVALGLNEAVNQMSKAEEEAKTQPKARAEPTTCSSCPQPCALLACGVPGAPYRGGAHGCTKLPYGDQKDSHHMPADSISPLPRDMAPAIQMDPRDHRLTNSYGASAATNAILAGQQNLIRSGNFLAAQAIDVAEIELKFPGKYTAAIAQMGAYTLCLKANGYIA